MLNRLIQTRWLYLTAPVLGFLLAMPFDFAHDASLRFVGVLFATSALVGYLFIVQFLTPKRAMLFGYLFGLAFFAWGLNWIYISMATFGGAPFAFAVAANAAVVAYLSLYWLLGTYIIVKLGKTPNQRLLLAPAVIALLEWVRSVFLIGFPWLSLGYGFVDFAWAQVAAIGGVFFVSFVVVLFVALLLFDTPQRWGKAPLTILLFLGIVMTVELKTTTPHEGHPSTTVTLIQGNMPVITEYNAERMTQNLVKYHLLTEAALAKKSPNVVIWPEAAIPYFYVEAIDFLEDIFALQQHHQFDLITGVPHADWGIKSTEETDIYNSILLQKANDQKPQFYNKSHLLPFGEYLPFRSVFAFFKEYVDIPMSDFARGEVQQKPFVAGGLTFAPSICFEAVFGDGIRQNAKQAQVLLNLSNDAWFGQSKAQIQHLNIARMRAIENQKMLVRATNDGRTAIISPNGKVLQAIPPFADGTLTATIYGQDRQTRYSKVGDRLVIGLCLLVICLLIGCNWLQYRKQQSH